MYPWLVRRLIRSASGTTVLAGDRPVVIDCVDFPYRQADAVNFRLTQADRVNFPRTAPDAVDFRGSGICPPH